jgi:signal transduction histidine kinase
VRIDHVFSSTSFRLSVAFAGLLIAAFVAAGLGVWVATRSIAERQTREHVTAEMQSIRQEISVEGLPAGIAAIENRASRPGALEYRLTSPEGQVLAGNLTTTNLRPGWQFVDLPDRQGLRHGQDDLVILSERLPDGAVLAIGGDLERGESVRIAVLQTLLWIGGLSAAIAIALGLWITRYTLRRMDLLSASLAAVAAGDLTARTVTRTPPRDDLDRLSAGANAMLEQITMLVANVRRVSTDVAHDLRTPLSHVRQDLELAAKDAAPQTLRHIETAQGRLEALLRTFDAMLRLAEIEAGRSRARFAPVDVAEVVESVADAYRPDVEARGGALVLVASKPLTIEGDADLMAQAVANLIENAMTHGGARPNISVGVRSDTNAWDIAVSDNGPGIAEADREKVLEPFARLDASRSTPGSGLGLAIVAAIARLHGANITLEDAGPGLRVVLRGARTEATTAA